MINLYLVFLILIIHWIADFVFQSDEVAKNKSTSWKHLLEHVMIYTSVLYFGFILFQHCFLQFLLFVLINGLSHFIIDAITSRINTYLYKKGAIHNFFVSIGFDQVLHLTILVISAYYFIKG